jgi:hypothetical protein
MTNVLPQAAGLTVGSVTYRYTAAKLPNDPLLVTVANQQARGTSYVFRSQDNWTGLSGNTITKTVGVDNIPGTYWGTGSISTQGIGSVQDVSVKYNYRYDTCGGTTSKDPSCPNYKTEQTHTQDYVSTSDFVADYNVWSYLEDSSGIVESAIEAEQTKKAQQLKKSVTNTLDNSRIAALLLAQNNYFSIPDYTRALYGGIYSDTLTLRDSKLPDSRNGARISFSQELLHTRMVDQQFIKRNPK